MKKILDFFKERFSKFMRMENKGVAILFGIQLALCLTAVVVAVIAASSVPTGTPPDGADIGGNSSLPDSLSFCYVTFDTDGGSRVAKQRVWLGDVPIEPKEPQKAGYYFVGWTRDGEPYDFTEGISSDTTLRASWHQMLSCVFEYGDGTESVTVTCRAGDTISAPKRLPSRDGAYFIGWSVDGEMWDFESAVTDSMTLTPSYSTTAQISLSLGFSPFLDSDVTLDREYLQGALKPVFAALSERFDTVFRDHTSDPDTEAELMLGSLNELCDKGAAGKGSLLDFRDYLDKMPNLSSYLEKNPTLYLSLFASSRDKSLYAIPIPEIYRMPAALPLFNEEIIRTLLDGDEPFISVDTTSLASVKCLPSISLSSEMRVPVLSGGEMSYFTKPNMLNGNILTLMNDRFGITPITGELAVNMLREYIDVMYGSRLERRSDLFLGEGAMYDSDELVALLRCVMLNRETLGLGADSGAVTVSSYDELLMLCEMMFGARGLSSESAKLYFDGEGELIDPRINENSYSAVRKMRDLIAEGLVKISDGENAYKDSVMTLYRVLSDGKRSKDTDFSIALPPLAYYADLDEVTRFLQTIDMCSERAVAASGLIKADAVKLNAVLAIVDHMYSDEGRALINLGGGAFCDGDTASELSKALSESLVAGDYDSYLRDYLGALPSSGSYISFGDTHADMLGIVQQYLAIGMIKRPNMLWEDDYLYSYAPSRISLTDYNEGRLEELVEITSPEGEFSFENENNIFVRMLQGYRPPYESPVDYFMDEIGGREYITIIRRAVGNLKTYYNTSLYS